MAEPDTIQMTSMLNQLGEGKIKLKIFFSAKTIVLLIKLEIGNLRRTVRRGRVGFEEGLRVVLGPTEDIGLVPRRKIILKRNRSCKW